jgi:hypothetical protein
MVEVVKNLPKIESKELFWLIIDFSDPGFFIGIYLVLGGEGIVTTR